MDERAQFYFQQAYQAQRAGDFDKAIDTYKKSIAVEPTAEAHTFLGWTYSMQGRTEEAISECRRAIEVDPDFGNPYNDIGAYLLEQGKPDEAVPWLQKALVAKRYEPRHYPHYNMSRALVLQGKWFEAVRELKAALEIFPHYELARRDLGKLLAKLN